jgi:glycosyltransferase involved in cell wall biosynthesis
MRVLHVVIGGELAGGQLVARTLIDGARAHGHEGVIVAPAPGPFTEAADEAGIPVRFADVSRSFRLRGFLALRRVIQDERIDLVHTHGDLASNVLSRIAARTTGRPVVSHMHGLTTFRSNPVAQALYRTADNLTARLCACLIAVSESTRAGLVSQGIPERLIVNIPNGLDPPEPSPAPAQLDVGGRRVVVCVGRVEPAKGQAELIEAAVRLPEDVAVVLVGRDVSGHQATLESRAVELGVADRVVFTGSRSDPFAVIAAATVVVLPSWSEGFPMVPLEAMAMRKAVVATAVGGTPEVVVDGVTGILVPPRDVERLAAALNELLADPMRVAALGEAGFERLRDHFSAATMVERVLEVQESALAGSS